MANQRTRNRARLADRPAAPTFSLDPAPDHPVPACIAPPEPAPEPAPEPPPAEAAAPARDANGFDPTEFEWRPVARRPRGDGWTPEVQRAFIQALADTGLVEHAAREVNMSVQSAYRLRRAEGAEGFARAWTTALAAAADRVLDLAFARAVEGEETPVFDRDGCRIGSRRKTNDRLTMFILRAYMPDRFRHAHEAVRRPSEAPPPVLPSIAVAKAALGPAIPAEPHRLLPPEDLAMFVADARAVADHDAAHPVAATPERYVAPRREADHPAAIARARTRRERAREREDRQAHRHERQYERRYED